MSNSIQKFSPDELLWEYKYRPKMLDDMVLPKRIYNKIYPMMQNDKNIRNMIFYSAQPGSGKTSTALLIPECLDLDYIKLNAGEGAGEGGVSAMREIKTYARKRSLNGKMKVVIIDEADGMSQQAQSSLRNIIDECSDTTRFILTCNYINKLILPLLSRMSLKVDFNIKPDEMDPLKIEFIKRCAYICKQEGVKVENAKVLYEIVKYRFPDYRQVIEDLNTASIENDKNITAESLDSILNGLDAERILTALKNKDFPKIKELALRYSTDMDRLLTNLFEFIMDKVSGDTRLVFIKYMAYLNNNASSCVSREILISEALINMSMKLKFVK